MPMERVIESDSRPLFLLPLDEAAFERLLANCENEYNVVVNEPVAKAVIFFLHEAPNAIFSQPLA